MTDTIQYEQEIYQMMKLLETQNYDSKVKTINSFLLCISKHQIPLSQQSQQFILGHVCCLCDTELIDTILKAFCTKINTKIVRAFIFEMSACQFSQNGISVKQKCDTYKHLLKQLFLDMPEYKKTTSVKKITETIMRSSLNILNRTFINYLLTYCTSTEYLYVFHTILASTHLFINNYVEFTDLLEYILSAKPDETIFSEVKYEFVCDPKYTDTVIDMMLTIPESRKIITLLSKNNLDVSSLLPAIVEYCIRTNIDENLNDIIQLLLDCGATIKNLTIYVETHVNTVENITENKATKLIRSLGYNIWFI